MRRRHICFLWGLVLTAGSPAVVAQVDYSVRAGVEHSDNIGRRASTEIDETLAYAGLTADFEHQAPELEVRIRSDAEFVSYLDGVFDDELLFNFDGDALWWIVRDRLSWEIHDSFGQIGTDPFESVTPVNREDTNFLRTGPDLLFRMGANQFRVGGRFVDDSYENSPADNQRLSAHAAVTRQVSPGRTVTVDAMTERVEFDEVGVNSDFDRQRYSVTFASTTSRSSLEVAAGVTEVHDYLETFSTMFSRVNFERQLTGETSVWFMWQTDFSDAGQSFRFLQRNETRFADVQNVIPVSDPFKMKNAELGFRFASDTSGGSLSAYWTDEAYEISTSLDRQLTGIRANADRAFTRRVTGRVMMDYQNSDFGNRSLSFDDLYLGAELSVRMSRQLSTSIFYRRYDRSSDSVAVNEYTENRYGIGVVFSGR